MKGQSASSVHGACHVETTARRFISFALWDPLHPVQGEGKVRVLSLILYGCEHTSKYCRGPNLEMNVLAECQKTYAALRNLKRYSPGACGMSAACKETCALSKKKRRHCISVPSCDMHQCRRRAIVSSEPVQGCAALTEAI
jgi:hypothetical protein